MKMIPSHLRRLTIDHRPSTLAHPCHRLSTIVCGLLLFLLISCQQTNQPPSTTHQPNKRGVHMLLADTYHDWDDAIWYDHLDYASQTVGEWGYVVQLIRLDDLDLTRWQAFMDHCADLKLTPVIRLATTPNPAIGGWDAPPQDADGRYDTIAQIYATFLNQLVWPTDQHFIVVHNEPNHGNEWGGMPNPAEYAHFLQAVSQAIKETDGQAVVLNAGFDTYAPHTNGQEIMGGPPLMDVETFMDEMVAEIPDIFTYIDGWTSHSYPAQFTSPPHVQSYTRDLLNGATNPYHDPPPDGLYNRGINSYEWELWKLEKYGIRNLPVYILETGWRTGEGWADPEDAAEYLTQAMLVDSVDPPRFTAWDADPRVVAAVTFAFDGDPNRWFHTNWLDLDAEGAVLNTSPQFEAWQSIYD